MTKQVTKKDIIIPLVVIIICFTILLSMFVHLSNGIAESKAERQKTLESLDVYIGKTCRHYINNSVLVLQSRVWELGNPGGELKVVFTEAANQKDWVPTKSLTDCK